MNSMLSSIEFFGDLEDNFFGLPLSAVTGDWGCQWEWDDASIECVADVSLWSHSI